jgi:biuret amidohydrolase
MKHAFGLSIPQTIEDAVDLESTALIVYDMQVGIIRQMTHGEEVLAKGWNGARGRT